MAAPPSAPAGNGASARAYRRCTSDSREVPRAMLVVDGRDKVSQQC